VTRVFDKREYAARVASEIAEQSRGTGQETTSVDQKKPFLLALFFFNDWRT
jgi:hypothetical protein